MKPESSAREIFHRARDLLGLAEAAHGMVEMILLRISSGTAITMSVAI